MAEVTEHASVQDFLAACPEFKPLPSPSLVTYLEDCRNQVAPCAWRESTRRAHILATAHALATSPLGRPLKLQNARGGTPYGEELERLRNGVSVFRAEVL